MAKKGQLTPEQKAVLTERLKKGRAIKKANREKEKAESKAMEEKVLGHSSDTTDSKVTSTETTTAKPKASKTTHHYIGGHTLDTD